MAGARGARVVFAAGALRRWAPEVWAQNARRRTPGGAGGQTARTDPIRSAARGSCARGLVRLEGRDVSG